jgi:hypothetical protein
MIDEIDEYFVDNQGQKRSDKGHKAMIKEFESSLYDLRPHCLVFWV